MRPVKLGRMWLAGPIALHWAVKVGRTWYEIEGAGKKNSEANTIWISRGLESERGATEWAGQLVGETDKNDEEIDDWIHMWLDRHPFYKFTSKNCQKFAYEFMDWLTDGDFNCPQRFNAAETAGIQGLKAFAGADDGDVVLRIGGPELRSAVGILDTTLKSPELQVNALAGAGFGLWGNASLCKAEVSIGNVVGAHFEPNLNTGAGIRNGNVDVHFLGNGFKLGADGLEINTPLGGVNACLLM